MPRGQAGKNPRVDPAAHPPGWPDCPSRKLSPRQNWHLQARLHRGKMGLPNETWRENGAERPRVQATTGQCLNDPIRAGKRAGIAHAPAWSVNGQLTSKRSPGLTSAIGMFRGDLKPGQVEGGKSVPPIFIGLSKNAFQLGGLQGRVTGTPSQLFRREEFDLFARRQFAVRINDSENVSFSYNCYAHKAEAKSEVGGQRSEDGRRKTEDYFMKRTLRENYAGGKNYPCPSVPIRR